MESSLPLSCLGVFWGTFWGFWETLLGDGALLSVLEAVGLFKFLTFYYEKLQVHTKVERWYNECP